MSATPASMLGFGPSNDERPVWVRLGLREPFARMSAVRLEPVCPRRPSILMRRALAARSGELPVYRGEREIIARD